MVEHFRCRLRDGDRIVFEGISGYLESGRERPGGRRRLEVHQGGVLSLDLPTARPYRLEREDGVLWEGCLTTVHASNSAGIALLEFRVVGGP